MSVTAAAQITAVATLALAAFAFIAAILAGLAFRKQSREVGILAEQNERDISDRRRDQASRVFMWAEADFPDPPDQTVIGLITHIKNTSHRPVYDGLSRFRDASGRLEDMPYTPVFLALMPRDQVDTGNGFTEPVPFPVFWQDKSRLQASVRFRDAAGVYWELDTDGQLDEVPAQERQGNR
jgi:hypothetical protein